MKIHNKKLLLGSFITFIAMFLFAINVQACTDQQIFELREAGRLVRTTIEVVERVVEFEAPDEYGPGTVTVELISYSFRLDTFNITDNIFVTMTNNITREVTTIHSEMLEDGIFVYVTGDLENVVDYNFRVYSFADGCFGQHLRTYTVRKPMFNLFSDMPVCHGIDEVPYCQKFINEEFQFSMMELPERIERFLAGPTQEPGDGQGPVQWFRNNVAAILITLIILAIITGGTVFVVGKRRSI